MNCQSCEHCECEHCQKIRREEYVENVRRGLEDLEAVSTGTCPGCSECMEAHGFTYSDDPDDGAKYSTLDEAKEAHREAWSDGEVDSESSFSWHPCGICGSSLGGDREVWHYIDKQGNIRHEEDACVDCVMYLGNGDIPSR